MTTSLESALLRIEGQKARIAALGKNIDERDEQIDVLTKALRAWQSYDNGPVSGCAGRKEYARDLTRSALSLAGVK